MHTNLHYYMYIKKEKKDLVMGTPCFVRNGCPQQIQCLSKEWDTVHLIALHEC